MRISDWSSDVCSSDLTTLFDRLACAPGELGELALIGFDVGKARALQARHRVFETQVDDLIVQADDLEQLRTAIRGDRRDTHLRDDLVQTLVDRLAIRLRELLGRSEEHTSELQSLMRISYAVFCLKKKNQTE